LETERAALHAVVRIVRGDDLAIRFDSGEELYDQTAARLELITHQSRAEILLAIELGSCIIGIGAHGKRAVVAIAAVTGDGSEPPAGRIESLAEGIAAAQIRASVVVAHFEAGEEFVAWGVGLRAGPVR